MTIEDLPQITSDEALRMLRFIPNSAYCPTDGVLYIANEDDSIGQYVCRVAQIRKMKKFKPKD